MQMYLYSVLIFNEEFEGDEELLSGITYGTNYADAMAHIEDYYGPILLSVNYLTEGPSEVEVVEIPNDYLESIQENMIY